MTLIEVMVAVLIVAMFASVLFIGFNTVTRQHMRSACLTLSGAARYAYGRAVAQNSTVRLVFDLDTHQMRFEEAHGRVTLARLDDATREELDEEEGGDNAAVDPWAAAQARLGDTLNPSFGASPFSPVPGSRYEAQELADGVLIHRVIVPHEPDPVTEGQASIYFFPGGHTEHAVVWVGDDEDRVYSVEIHPLTGRTRVYDYAYEPEQLLDDGHGGSRSEVD